MEDLLKHLSKRLQNLPFTSDLDSSCDFARGYVNGYNSCINQVLAIIKEVEDYGYLFIDK